MVLPVTVRHSPCSRPASSKRFISGLIPPMAMISDIRYLPLGRTSASTGTRLPMRLKSSRESLTPASCAMASRCSTALVEPASAMVTVIAFSKALRVRMSRGSNSRLQQANHRLPCAPAVFMLVLAHGFLRRAVWQGKPQCLDGRSHGVGGVHAATAAGARNGRALHFEQLRLADLAAGAPAHRLEYRDDVGMSGRLA